MERAEELLQSLTGVVSARVVTRAGGEIEEIHVLTTDEVSPKQTVRNVESALLAHLGVSVDHRKISVAQTRDGREREAVAEAAGPPGAGPRAEERLIYVGHEAEAEVPHRVRFRVALRWAGEEYVGEETGADLGRARLETVARATLQAIEQALRARIEGGAGGQLLLALDGVKVVEAFDRRFVLVAVNAMYGREITPLAGAAGMDDIAERAAILATLQATDRWVRGRVP